MPATPLAAPLPRRKGSRRSTASASSAWSGCCVSVAPRWPAPRPQSSASCRRRLAGRDLELDAPVEGVDCVVAAAADDVLAKAHADRLGATAERCRLVCQPLADDVGALQ